MKMIYRLYLSAILCLSGFVSAAAQDVFGDCRGRWMEIAEQTIPELTVTEVSPVSVVEVVADTAAFQGWRCIPKAGLDTLSEANFRRIRSVTLDFGRHLTGRLKFRLKTLGDVMDAPVKLKFVFGETPAELAEPLTPGAEAFQGAGCKTRCSPWMRPTAISSWTGGWPSATCA